MKKRNIRVVHNKTVQKRGESYIDISRSFETASPDVGQNIKIEHLHDRLPRLESNVFMI
jgi:hypothetical protein